MPLAFVRSGMEGTAVRPLHVVCRLPQAFYYVVNAGLSIGWCEGTLAETSDTSRAFTIMFIIAG